MRHAGSLAVAVLLGGCSTSDSVIEPPVRTVADHVDGGATALPHASACVVGGIHVVPGEIKITASPGVILLHLHRGPCSALGPVVAEAAGELRLAATADEYSLVLENPTDGPVAYSFRFDFMTVR